MDNAQTVIEKIFRARHTFGTWWAPCTFKHRSAEGPSVSKPSVNQVSLWTRGHRQGTVPGGKPCDDAASVVSRYPMLCSLFRHVPYGCRSLGRVARMKHCLIWRGTWGKVLEGSRGDLGVREKCRHYGHRLWVRFGAVVTGDARQLAFPEFR